jgi:hypothetical protein
VAWDPYRQEDEKGNRMTPVTSNRGLLLRPISTAVPAFGKRKISEVDNVQSDETFNVSDVYVLK